MSITLQDLTNIQKISETQNKAIITYNCKLPLIIKEVKFINNAERESILKKIKKIKNELGFKIIDYFEQNDKMFILFLENNDIIDDIFEIKEELVKEACMKGHSEPIYKKEFNNIFAKELSMCKIHFKIEENNQIKSGIGTGFFCKLDIKEIPFKYGLFTNNHVLNRNNVKTGKEIILDYKDEPVSRIIEITSKRRTFTDEELDYTCIEITENDKIFNNYKNQLLKIDQNILEGKSDLMLDHDIFILQYPNGKDLSLSIGKIKQINNKIIFHTASTSSGSSGAPIIKRDDYSIIGLHFGYKTKINNKNEFQESNLATNFCSIINDIKRKVLGLSEISQNLNKKELYTFEYFKNYDHLKIIKYKPKNSILLNSIIPELKDNVYCNATNKRIIKEFYDLKINFFQYEGFQIYGLINKKLICAIEGPKKTPYEHGFFLLEIIVENGYPLINKLQCNFKTKIFHPNIGENGLTFFENHPAMTLGKTLIFIQSILDDPNPECCLNEKAGNLYYMDRKKYEETAREFTLKYGNFRTFENQLKEYHLKIEHFTE